MQPEEETSCKRYRKYIKTFKKYIPAAFRSASTEGRQDDGNKKKKFILVSKELITKQKYHHIGKVDLKNERSCKEKTKDYLLNYLQIKMQKNTKLI